MRRVRGIVLAAAAMFLAACEDGPEQVFEPNEGDPTAQNGWTPQTPLFPDGEKGYGTVEGGGDEVARARFCSEAENGSLLQWMVQQPIVPDVGLGGVPLWTPEGTPTFADDLLGPSDDLDGDGAPDGFCDPDIYSDGFVWGPTYEVIFLFDVETHLTDYMIATQQYLGTLGGKYTKVADDGTTEEVSVDIKMRDRVRLTDANGVVELDQYSGGSEQANKPRSWLNHKNINAIYRMIRETYFGAEPIDPAYDCVASKVCSIFYSSDRSQSVPQETQVYFLDSEVLLVFSPEGNVINVALWPVRVAPFETSSKARFGVEDAETVSPLFESLAVPTCSVPLGADLSWAQFKDRCIGDDDSRSLNRVNYVTSAQRDAVFVSFNGMELGFRRNVSEHGVFADGERPGDEDLLYYMSLTRSLNAPFEEFVPKALAQAYVERLKARLAAAVKPAALKATKAADGGVDVDGGDEPDSGTDGTILDAEVALDHPFLDLEIPIPDDLSEEPTPIEQLYYTAGGQQVNYIDTVVATVTDAYNALTPEERARLDSEILEPTWLIEPYVQVVMESFTHGKMNDRFAYNVFENSDDKRWVIGSSHFIQDNVPYRFTVQYSLNYGAVTSVQVSFGYSELDQIFNGWNKKIRPREGLGQPQYPYYSIDLALGSPDDNPFALGGTGIRLLGFERQLGTIDVNLVTADETVFGLVVPGEPIEDRAGYLRQIRGERFEFVPATKVELNGKETGMTFYVEADGKIGRVAQAGFKRPMELCAGLSIGYGDDVKATIEAWSASVGVETYRQCELIFNYSPNGNVLSSVSSLANRMAISVTNGRATQVDVWR